MPPDEGTGPGVRVPGLDLLAHPLLVCPGPILFLLKVAIK